MDKNSLVFAPGDKDNIFSPKIMFFGKFKGGLNENKNEKGGYWSCSPGSGRRHSGLESAR